MRRGNQHRALTLLLLKFSLFGANSEAQNLGHTYRHERNRRNHKGDDYDHLPTRTRRKRRLHQQSSDGSSSGSYTMDSASRRHYNGDGTGQQEPVPMGGLWNNKNLHVVFQQEINQNDIPVQAGVLTSGHRNDFGKP